MPFCALLRKALGNPEQIDRHAAAKFETKSEVLL
jgi:hypothetical protein